MSPHGQPVTRHTSASGAVNIPTTSETVVATLSDVETTGAGDAVDLQGSVDITAGTGATAVTLRVRRGGVAGAVVRANNPQTIAAGNTATLDIEATDNPGDVAGQVYVLTVQQTAASANGTVNHADLRATY